MNMAQVCLKEAGGLLKITEIAGRHFSLIATRDLAVGEVLIHETPVVCCVLPGHEELANLCPSCLKSMSPSVEDEIVFLTHPKSPVCCDACFNSNSNSNSDCSNKNKTKFTSFASQTDNTMLLAGRLALYESTHQGFDFVKDFAKEDSPTSSAEVLDEGLRLLLSDFPEVKLTKTRWRMLVSVCHLNAAAILLPSRIRDMLEGAIDGFMDGEGDGGSIGDTLVGEIEAGVRSWCEKFGQDYEVGEEEEDSEEDVSDSRSGSDSDFDSDFDSDSDSGTLKLAPDAENADKIQLIVSAFNNLPATEATGLFPALALINHSCAPNVEIEFLDRDFTASVVAKKEIKKGAEICHCYVQLDKFEDVTERRAVLAEQHGFECLCELCAQQLSEHKSSKTTIKKRKR